jgi:hypothetical protein
MLPKHRFRLRIESAEISACFGFGQNYNYGRSLIDTPRGSKLSMTVQGPPSQGYRESTELIRNDPI